MPAWRCRCGRGARDVTQRRCLDRALQETHTALEQGRFEGRATQLRLGALLAGMVEALQRPLAGLDGLAQLLAPGRAGPVRLTLRRCQLRRPARSAPTCRP